jgi:hypothetical protein
MKQYPTISKVIRRDIDIYAFDKFDGSNIRAEWTRKNGFFKFGSRNVLIDDKHKDLGKSISLMQSKYEDDLSNIFRKERFDKVTCFFEFFGPNSFGGQHNPNDDHSIILLDINPHKRGILDPRQFLKMVGHLDVPRLLYQGKANAEFENSVRDSSINITFEGVVCKGMYRNTLVMFKIKSNAWIEKLKQFCGGDLKLFEELY